jgi:hypothetical protein
VARPADLPPPIGGITRPNLQDHLSTRAEHFLIKGSALDPNAGPGRGTGIDRVLVYLDEPRGTDGSKFIGEAQLGGSTPDLAAAYGQQFMESGFSIDMRPADFKAGDHHVYAYIRSSVSGKETVLLAGFDMHDP